VAGETRHAGSLSDTLHHVVYRSVQVAPGVAHKDDRVSVRQPQALQEMGCGSGMTCWRRLRDWQAEGVWQEIWRVLLDELGLAEAIDWSTSAIDSCSVRALFGG
jgi:hypothetical protein